MGYALKKRTLLNVARMERQISCTHSYLHRRLQIALVLHRKKRDWKSPLAKRLILKYGVPEC